MQVLLHVPKWCCRKMCANSERVEAVVVRRCLAIHGSSNHEGIAVLIASFIGTYLETTAVSKGGSIWETV
jgi:hypothetical protein